MPRSVASMTPPVIMSLTRSAPCACTASTCASASSTVLAAMATEPAMCPPGTEMPSFAASTRGPMRRPARISSRRRVSNVSSPPTVRIVVTPPSSSVRAKEHTMR